MTGDLVNAHFLNVTRFKYLICNFVNLWLLLTYLLPHAQVQLQSVLLQMSADAWQYSARSICKNGGCTISGCFFYMYNEINLIPLFLCLSVIWEHVCFYILFITCKSRCLSLLLVTALRWNNLISNISIHFSSCTCSPDHLKRRFVVKNVRCNLICPWLSSVDWRRLSVDVDPMWNCAVGPACLMSLLYCLAGDNLC